MAADSITDTTGVHGIANTTNPDRVADIVFVHGLGGKSHGTWTNRNGFFWPEELGKELPQCGIWSLGYEAEISQVTGSGMVIGLRAMSIASLLTNSAIGTKRPVVFITHSMGGLVVKALVDGCRQNTDPDAEKLVRNVGGIAFCGTPHRGSNYATAASLLAKLLGGSTDWVKEMHGGETGIELLHGRFLGWFRHNPIPILTLAETNISFGLDIFGFKKQLGIIVPLASARLAMEAVHQHLNADHLQLVKPPGFADITYGRIKAFIDDILLRIAGTPPALIP
jgi:hypothetical protein